MKGLIERRWRYGYLGDGSGCKVGVGSRGEVERMESSGSVEEFVVGRKKEVPREGEEKEFLKACCVAVYAFCQANDSV